jgi:AcrR family transcriptional regulator
MAHAQLVRDHVRTAILDAAALVIAEHNDSASMTRVAAAAGVSRATLYRYFASREDLLRALSAAAVEDAGARLTAADLDAVTVVEALARISRALIACGDKYALTAEEWQHGDPEEVARRIGDPLRVVLRRGVDDGTLRADIRIDVLAQLWGGLIQGAFRSMRRFGGGVERTSAEVTSIFLRGAAPLGED